MNTIIYGIYSLNVRSRWWRVTLNNERTRQPTYTRHSTTPATTQDSKTPQTQTPYWQPGTHRRITLTYKTSTPEECRWATHPHTSFKTPHYYIEAIKTTFFHMKTKVFLFFFILIRKLYCTNIYNKVFLLKYNY
jgi:hypothetical protein